MRYEGQKYSAQLSTATSGGNMSREAGEVARSFGFPFLSIPDSLKRASFIHFKCGETLKENKQPSRTTVIPLAVTVKL